MKTFKLAILLFLIIIFGSIWYIHTLNNITDELLSKIDVLEDSVKDEQWSDAEKELDDMYEYWEKTEKWISTLINHNEIDVIKVTLAKLSQYIHYRETVEIMAEMASLKLLIRHIPNKEKLNLSNLF